MRLPPLEACLLVALAACSSTPAGGPPEGFELVYSQDFESASWSTDFGASDPALWAPASEDGGGTAYCRGSRGREGPFGSPPDFLWLGGVSVGDFVLEFDVLLPEPGVAELAVYFGIESPESFVYASLAPHAGARAHDVFRVDHAPPLSISRQRTFGVALPAGVWQRVRVARSTVGGRVSVGFGEGRRTVLTAGNGALAPGWIGFGVRGGPAHFDQVRLWAPEWTMRSLDFLPPPLQGAQSRR
jgi:hypothetical protein